MHAGTPEVRTFGGLSDKFFRHRQSMSLRVGLLLLASQNSVSGVNFRHAFPVFSARRLEFSASTAENSKRLAHFCSLGGRKTKTEKHAPEMGRCFSVCLAKVWEIGLFLPTYILRMWSLQASMSHLGVEVAPQMPTVFAPSNHSGRMASGPSTM